MTLFCMPERAVLGGRYYAKTGDSDLALHHYTDALETMGEAGDPLVEFRFSLVKCFKIVAE